jgi:hypothetical protein
MSDMRYHPRERLSLNKTIKVIIRAAGALLATENQRITRQTGHLMRPCAIFCPEATYRSHTKVLSPATYISLPLDSSFLLLAKHVYIGCPTKLHTVNLVSEANYSKATTCAQQWDR